MDSSADSAWGAPQNANQLGLCTVSLVAWQVVWFSWTSCNVDVQQAPNFSLTFIHPHCALTFFARAFLCLNRLFFQPNVSWLRAVVVLNDFFLCLNRWIGQQKSNFCFRRVKIVNAGLFDCVGAGYYLRKKGGVIRQTASGWAEPAKVPFRSDWC